MEESLITERELSPGLVTDRGLSWKLNRRDSKPAYGVLELLGLEIEELEGRRVLDVGIGGARALEHAIALGIDYYGVDFLPLIDTDKLSLLQRANIVEMKRRFMARQTQYPGRLIGADFCSEQVPYATNQFDIVLSVGALPGYARNSQKATQSLLNMINVASQRVVVSGGWDKHTNPDGVVLLGGGKSRFSYPMRGLAEILKTHGVTTQNRKVEIRDRELWVFDLDVVHKIDEDITASGIAL